MLYGSDCDEPRFHITVFAEEHDEQFRVRFADVTALQTLASPLQKEERPTREKGTCIRMYISMHACQLCSLYNYIYIYSMLMNYDCIHIFNFLIVAMHEDP